MRILDSRGDRPLSHVTLYLTEEEALELQGSLRAILNDHTRHEHVPSADYQKELTVCIYDSGSNECFDERSRRLINQDK